MTKKRRANHGLKAEGLYRLAQSLAGDLEVTQKLEQWNRWLQVIYEDMAQQAASRAVFRETAAIIAANPNIPKENDFLDFLEQWYVDSIFMGLRRQLKVSADSVSLVRLLSDTAAHPAVL